MLLLLDKHGKFVGVPALSLEHALAGAVLMDLALEGRIDTDPDRLFVIDPTPLGDELLDPTLAHIVQSARDRIALAGRHIGALAVERQVGLRPCPAPIPAAPRRSCRTRAPRESGNPRVRERPPLSRSPIAPAARPRKRGSARRSPPARRRRATRWLRHGRYFPAELAVWLHIPPQAAPGSRRGLSQRAAAPWQMGPMSSGSAHSGQERAQPRARADYRAQNSAVMSRVFHSPARCPRLKLRGSFSLTFQSDPGRGRASHPARRTSRARIDGRSS